MACYKYPHIGSLTENPLFRKFNGRGREMLGVCPPLGGLVSIKGRQPTAVAVASAIADWCDQARSGCQSAIADIAARRLATYQISELVDGLPVSNSIYTTICRRQMMYFCPVRATHISPGLQPWVKGCQGNSRPVRARECRNCPALPLQGG
jgi:hypothetical protein